MTTRRSPYGGEPFRVSDGLRQGLGRGALNGPRSARPFHGVREWVGAGAESPWETRLRLALVDGGLPEPWLAYELCEPDGTFVARLDQAYPEYRVAVEYDGRQHAEDTAQFARDADRWQQIADLDWRLVRILHHHLHPDPSVAVERVRRALARAGWTG